MTALENLKKSTCLSDLAILLGYKPKILSYILYIIPNELKYTEFTIPKKNGGLRNIKKPVEKLKRVQTNLAKILSDCFEEINGKVKHQRPLSHGYRKNYSIITNASKHTNKRHVLNIDLEDFFPSIHFGRVINFFIKNAHFELNSKVATVIAQIACHDNELPQGSPCSPIISNFIGHILDIRMVNVAKKAKCTYSRYVDDLTFSTNKREFPDLIAVKKYPHGTECIIGEELIKELKRARFSLNNKKTSLQYKSDRQVATGLIVNEKINIKREYYKRARTMCYSLFNTDEFYVGSKSAPPAVVTDKSVNTTPVEMPQAINMAGNIKQLEGILSYIYKIKGPYDNNSQGDKLHKPKGITKLYKEFLFYKYFFINGKPLVICEGKTDTIYLKCALRQLVNDYPKLVQKNDKVFDYNIRLMDLSKNLRKVFSMAEGSSGLLALIDIYKKQMEPFKGQGRNHPVIIFADNDGGAKHIKSKYTKDSTKAFYHISLNLYVLFTPLSASGENTAIEDLFDSKTLGYTVGGKTFNPKAKLNPKTEYGKTVFAAKVVNAHQNNLDFTGFKDTLSRIEAIIDDYKQKKPQT